MQKGHCINLTHACKQSNVFALAEIEPYVTHDFPDRKQNVR